MNDEFNDLLIVDTEEAVPDHKAGRLESDESSDELKPSQRPGIFARQSRSRTKTEKTEKASRPRKPPPENRPGQFVEPLTELYATIGIMVAPFSPSVGMTIAQQAESCATALDKAAQQNETLRKALASITATSVWGAVIMAHAPIVGAIIVNHTELVDSDSESRMSTLANQFMGTGSNGTNHVS